MTQEEKMQEEVTVLATLVPQIQKEQNRQSGKIDDIWIWITGDGMKPGASDTLRKHDEFIQKADAVIQEQIANRKSNKRIFLERAIWGGIALGLLVLDALIFYKLGG
jgi:hypothetical protein